MEQEQFQKKLEEILAEARKNHNELTEERLREAFGEVASDPKHREILLAYFAAKNVTVYTGDEKSDQEKAAKAVEEEFSYTPEDQQYLLEYQRELEELPALSDAQLQALCAGALDGDVEAQGQLLQAFLGKASDLARTFVGQGVYLEDLIGEANLALAEAIPELERYVEKEDSLAETARQVEGFLGSRMIDALEQMVRMEMAMKQEDQAMADQINKVADAASELSTELGRKTTVKELSENTDLTQEQIRDVVRFLGKGSEDLLLEPEPEEEQEKED